NFEYSARGDLIAERTADLQIEFERDLLGRLMKTRSSGWNENVETAFERDANGRVTAELQQGRRVAYQRSVEGFVTDRVLPNGAKTQYQYDNAGALSSVVHDGFHLEFERDATGREISRNANRAVRVEQKHDSLGRLLESRQQLLQETFEHDAADSIIGWVTQLGADGSGAARSAAKTEKAQVGPGNVLLRRGTTEYRYDARGRRTAKIALDKDGKQQTTLYDWDGRDRLRRILRPDGVQLNYSYDAFGRRVHKIRRAADGALSNNNFVWDGEVLAAELDDQRGPRAFVHEPGGFEPVLQQQGGE